LFASGLMAGIVIDRVWLIKEIPPRDSVVLRNDEADAMIAAVEACEKGGIQVAGEPKALDVQFIASGSRYRLICAETAAGSNGCRLDSKPAPADN
jgi:hypothetical protein